MVPRALDKTVMRARAAKAPANTCRGGDFIDIKAAMKKVLRGEKEIKKQSLLWGERTNTQQLAGGMGYKIRRKLQSKSNDSNDDAVTSTIYTNYIHSCINLRASNYHNHSEYLL